MDPATRSQLTGCIVSTSGGHLTEVLTLERAFGRHRHFFVINDRIDLPPEMARRTYFIIHAERSPKVLVNFVEAWRILRRERPHVILSTGAGPAVPFAIVGRMLFGTRVIFVEIITRLSRPSLTGRLMYWLAHDFYYQWPGLERSFPRAVHGGPVT